jgi:hypothetical protein
MAVITEIIKKELRSSALLVMVGFLEFQAIGLMD